MQGEVILLFGGYSYVDSAFDPILREPKELSQWIRRSILLMSMLLRTRDHSTLSWHVEGSRSLLLAPHFLVILQPPPVMKTSLLELCNMQARVYFCFHDAV